MSDSVLIWLLGSTRSPHHYLVGFAYLLGVGVLFGIWVWWGLGWVGGRQNGWGYFFGSLLLFLVCIFMGVYAAILLTGN